MPGRRHARAGRSPRASEVGARDEPAGLTGQARVPRSARIDGRDAGGGVARRDRGGDRPTHGGCGRAAGYENRGDSGFGPYPAQASLPMVRAPKADGLARLQRVFRRRCGIGKRSAQALGTVTPCGPRPAPRGSVRRRRIGPDRRNARSSPPLDPLPYRTPGVRPETQRI